MTVSTSGNAKSLRGGSLLMAPLKGADGNVYAVAQGSLVVNGFGAEAKDGSKVSVNIPSAGRIPNGATVERAVPNPFALGASLVFNLHTPDFTTAQRLTAAINSTLGGNMAQSIDATSIRVNAPLDSTQRVAFVSVLENLTIEPGEAAARVIINRTYRHGGDRPQCARAGGGCVAPLRPLKDEPSLGASPWTAAAIFSSVSCTYQCMGFYDIPGIGKGAQMCVEAWYGWYSGGSSEGYWEGNILSQKLGINNYELLGIMAWLGAVLRSGVVDKKRIGLTSVPMIDQAGKPQFGGQKAHHDFLTELLHGMASGKSILSKGTARAVESLVSCRPKGF